MTPKITVFHAQVADWECNGLQIRTQSRFDSGPALGALVAEPNDKSTAQHSVVVKLVDTLDC